VRTSLGRSGCGGVCVTSSFRASSLIPAKKELETEHVDPRSMIHTKRIHRHRNTSREDESIVNDEEKDQNRKMNTEKDSQMVLTNVG
jgi:hypothetical protein